MPQRMVLVTSAVDHLCHSRRQKAVAPVAGSMTNLVKYPGKHLRQQESPGSVVMTVHRPANRKERILPMDLPLTAVPQASAIFADKLSTQQSVRIVCGELLAQGTGTNIMVVKNVGPKAIMYARKNT